MLHRRARGRLVLECLAQLDSTLIALLHCRRGAHHDATRAREQMAGGLRVFGRFTVFSGLARLPWFAVITRLAGLARLPWFAVVTWFARLAVSSWLPWFAVVTWFAVIRRALLLQLRRARRHLGARNVGRNANGRQKKYRSDSELQNSAKTHDGLLMDEQGPGYGACSERQGRQCKRARLRRTGLPRPA